MSNVAIEQKKPRLSGRFFKRSWRRFSRSDDGAAAIEFAILSVPYFIIIFAILETFVAFAAEQLVTNAVNTLGRQLRTGEISGNSLHANYKNVTQFRQLFCNEISIIIKCSADEVSTPSKLYIDAQNFTSFALVPTSIPRKSTDVFADIDASKFKYAPGGPNSINMLRAYYRWQVITDLVRPYITNIRPGGGVRPTDFLIVATTTFKNENYP